MEVKKERIAYPPWTAEEDAKLKELWIDYSSYQLAKVFGKSRMAIIGRAHRLGMKKGVSKRDRSITRKLGQSTLKTLFVKDHTFSISRVKVAPSKPNEQIVKEPFLGVHIADIKNNQCRYMHESSSLMFCGHATQKGSSYCPNHHQYMFTGEIALRPRHQRGFYR